MWKIISVQSDNVNNNNYKNSNNTKKPLVPRFYATKDKYWDSLYGEEYSKTLTLVGFDRTSTTVTVPKKVLPLLIEWNSGIQYEVDGKILPQPRDWANLSTNPDEDKVDGEDGDDNNNELASMADIESQISTPYVLNSSPTRSTSSFDTPTHSSVSTLAPTSTTSIHSKKGTRNN